MTTKKKLQNRYRIDTEINQAGNETLYRAWDSQSDYTVTIKEITPPSDLDARTLAELRQTLRQKASKLHKLKHPNLISVLDFFEIDNKSYLVMESVEGQSLADRVSHAGIMREIDIVGWTEQILEALIYCHEQGILHQDIKPENIIIRPNNQAVLVDFGLIKLQPKPTKKATIPLIGTAPYAPPEQYTAILLEQADPRNDLYSLGATIYYTLTGFAPPASTSRVNLHDSAAALYKSLIGEDISASKSKQATNKDEVSIQEHNPIVTAHTEAVVVKAMSVNREMRYPTAQAMLDALTKKKSGAGLIAGIIAVVAILLLGGWFMLSSSDPTAEATVAAVIPTTENLPETETPTPTEEVADTPTPEVAPTDINSPTPAPTGTKIPKPTPTNTNTPAPTPTPTVGGVPAGFIRTRSSDNALMLYVPAGQFVMGSVPGQGQDSERPQHIINLNAFWMDRYEITSARFADFLNKAGNQTENNATWLKADDKEARIHLNNRVWQPDPGYADHPAVKMTWYGAQAYCRWNGARLPTEAEWEKAARGENGQTYSWGEEKPGCHLGNFWIGNGCVKDTTPIGTYPDSGSPYKMLDMSGNVWEWASDWYDTTYYTRSPQVNPQGPTSGEAKLLRGGSWSNPGEFARAGSRGYAKPTLTGNNVGFRCVQN